MKKKYTKPNIAKVKLNPEQAVLGTCSSDSGSMSDSNPSGYCKAHGGCKQRTNSGGTDSGASS
jgi:hypothetical protein